MVVWGGHLKLYRASLSTRPTCHFITRELWRHFPCLAVVAWINSEFSVERLHGQPLFQRSRLVLNHLTLMYQCKAWCYWRVDDLDDETSINICFQKDTRTSLIYLCRTSDLVSKIQFPPLEPNSSLKAFPLLRVHCMSKFATLLCHPIGSTQVFILCISQMRSLLNNFSCKIILAHRNDQQSILSG